MSLQFLRSVGQSDADQKMVQVAEEWLSNHQTGRVFFIVPNYNKFEKEIHLLRLMKEAQQTGTFSSINRQVFSFNRLAWFFLQKDGKIPGNQLSDAGNAMVLRKVLKEKEMDLTIFRGEINKTGFIEEVMKFYQEMQIGNLTVDDLSLLAGNKTIDIGLKMQDLQIILSAYEKELVQYQVENNDPLQLLSEYLIENKRPDDLFIVSGFTNFNGKEMQVLTTLMAQSQLLVALELDQPYVDQLPNPLELFAATGKTYYQLVQAAHSEKISVQLDLIATNEKNIFNQVGEFWRTQKPQKLEKTTPIQIWQTTTLAEEVRRVGNKIRQLVINDGYRYQDIQILVRNDDRYRSVIGTTFNQLAIPYYLDEKQKMSEHPLLDFLQALFLIDQYNYQITDVIRLLRTELFVPFEWTANNWQFEQKILREKIDQTENVALAYNFKGFYWTREKDWQFVDYDFESGEYHSNETVEKNSNLVRRMIQAYLPQFFEEIKNAENGRAAAGMFYRFLDQVGVKQQLLHWRDQEVERGFLEKARNHEQTWQALLDLLDEYVLIYGEEIFDWEIFQEIFVAGLVNLDYGKIPTTIDQVQINRLDVRGKQTKVTFALGLNDHDFPARFDDTGLLTADEREVFSQELPDDKFLPEANSQKVMSEPYVAYGVFLSASEKLFLSYATIVEESSYGISPFLKRLNAGLGLPIFTFENLNLTTNPTEYVGTFRTMISDVINLNRQSKDQQQPLPATWAKLGQSLKKNPEVGDLARKVFASLTDSNVPFDLGSDIAGKLYGKELYASVSRIENFYSCQFKYFANYGLKLKERSLYELTQAGKGDFYHEALDIFFKKLNEYQLNLAKISDEQRQKLADEVLAEVFGKVKFEILSSSPRMNYIRYQLAKTIEKVSWGLMEQSKRTNYQTEKTEVIFGSIAGQKGIKGLDLPLVNGGALHLRGKIDRIDTVTNQENQWFSVVDYKSSQQRFKLVDAYYGLALQLITYLDVAITDFSEGNNKAVKPGGAYYFHVQNPTIKPTDNVSEETLKEFKYNGLFVKDDELFEEMDKALAEGEKSALFPIEMTKKGDYSIGRNQQTFYNLDEIDLLRDYNKQNLKQAGDQIVSGELKLNPTLDNEKKKACEFCPFQSVCKFDVMMPDNQYNRFERLKREEILDRMRKDLENTEEESHE